MITVRKFLFSVTLLWGLGGCLALPPPSPTVQDAPLPTLYFRGFEPVGEKSDTTVFRSSLEIYANSLREPPGEEPPAFLNETPLLRSQAVTLRLRGQSSKSMDKKSLALTFVDPADPEVKKDQSLLDFPRGTDFILSSPWFSGTVLPNYLAPRLARLAGIPAPRVRLVEVYGSQLGDILETQYQGVYILMEKIQRRQTWVGVSKGTPEDLTGGYILKVDKESPGDRGFTTSLGQKVLFEYPNSTEITPEQTAYLTSYFNTMEDLLQKSPSLQSLSELIDLPSFADIFLFYEVLGNPDGLKYSSFFTKDRGGKLKAGPVWDHDLAMGQSKAAFPQETWRREAQGSWTITHNWLITRSQNHPRWWKLLISKPDFIPLLRSRWERMKALAFNEKVVQPLIDQALKALGVTWNPETQEGSWGALEQDEKFWPLGERWATKSSWPATVTWPQTAEHPLQVNYDWLKAYIKSRMTWLDQETSWQSLKVWSLGGKESP